MSSIEEIREYIITARVELKKLLPDLEKELIPPNNKQTYPKTDKFLNKTIEIQRELKKSNYQSPFLPKIMEIPKMKNFVVIINSAFGSGNIPIDTQLKTCIKECGYDVVHYAEDFIEYLKMLEDDMSNH